MEESLSLGYKGTVTLITEENCLQFGFESVEEFRRCTIYAPYIPELYGSTIPLVSVQLKQSEDDVISAL